jgi:hypothetical protein
MREIWRRIRTKPTFRSNAEESYFEKLLRYIPADIVAGYVALNGMISADVGNSASLQRIVFGVLLVLTPLYTCYLKTTPPGSIPEKVFPCLTAAFAFSVWVFALGGPFSAQWPLWYKPVYGSLALILTTLALPVLEKIFYEE